MKKWPVISAFNFGLMTHIHWPADYTIEGKWLMGGSKHIFFCSQNNEKRTEHLKYLPASKRCLPIDWITQWMLHEALPN